MCLFAVGVFACEREEFMLMDVGIEMDDFLNRPFLSINMLLHLVLGLLVVGEGAGVFTWILCALDAIRPWTG